MVRINKTGEIFVKLIYWGCTGSGKKTTIDTLYRIAKEGKYGEEIIPTGNPKPIAMVSGSSLYTDRGVFQSKKHSKIFYHIYIVGGHARFSPLRKKIFLGTDGVIFVFNGQRSRIKDNIHSLKELKNAAGNKLISEIPMLVMLNKQDLPNPVTKSEVYEILLQENMVYPKGHSLNVWNPEVYETIALYSNAQDVYKVFAELARRTAIYQAIGNGKAPDTRF